jgi:hypothetical protein
MRGPVAADHSPTRRSPVDAEDERDPRRCQDPDLCRPTNRPPSDADAAADAEERR